MRWTLDATGKTDRGKVRDRNEDQFLIATTRRTLEIDHCSLASLEDTSLAAVEGTLLVVADGMGGQGHGDLASKVAVQAMLEALCGIHPQSIFSALPPDEDTSGAVDEVDEDDDHVPPSPRRRKRRFPDTVKGVRSVLSEALQHSNRRVCEAGERTNGTIGTTMTLAYMVPPHLYLGHVGDSRCYLHTEDRLIRLTQDHTVAEQLKSAGITVREESQFHHVLRSALGQNEEGISESQVQRLSLRSGDTLLLCSDGLIRHVTDDEIQQRLAQPCPTKAICDELVGLALERGAVDNATVVIARIMAEPAAA